MKKLLSIFLFLIVGLSSLKAQYYLSGEAPASVKYSQIKTDHFQLIFPREHENSAKVFAANLSLIYDTITKYLDHKPPRVSVLLHTQTAVSNAFVAWAPKRMEIYAIPPSNNNLDDWFQTLAIHEYKHVVQLENMKSGLTNIFRVLFGEQAIPAVLGTQIPMWFLEGDAVVAETAYGKQGRGRLASFHRPLKAQLLSQGRFSYDKAVLGSYADYTPNQYELGYQLIAAGRLHAPHDPWQKATQSVARRGFLFWNLNLGMKKAFGHQKVKFYKQTLDSLKQSWEKELIQKDLSEIEEIAHEQHKYFTNYRYPFQYNGETYALKGGLGHALQWVKLGKKDKVIHRTSSVNAFSPVMKNGKLIWLENRPSLRYAHLNYNDLLIMDLKSQKVKRIHHKKRYFSPDINEAGSQIVCVLVDDDLSYSICLIDVASSKLIRRFPVKGIEHLQGLTYDEAGGVYGIAQINKEKFIIRFDFKKQSYEKILGPYQYDIQQLKFFNGNLYYRSEYNGTENICVFEPESGKHELITNVAYGATDPFYSTDKLLFSNYTSKGFRIVQLKRSPVITVEDNQGYRWEMAEKLSTMEGGKFDFTKIDTSGFKLQKYNRFLHSLNFHSWGVGVAPYKNNAMPGVSVLSQNKLGNTTIQAGYFYDFDNQSPLIGAHWKYSRFFPVLEVEYEKFERDYRVRYIYSDREEIQTHTLDFSTLTVSATAPLNFSRGNNLIGVNSGFSYQYVQQQYSDILPNEYYEADHFSSLSFEFSAGWQKRRSARDVGPRLGVTAFSTNSLLIQNNDAITPHHLYGGKIFLPGFTPHARFSGGYSRLDNENSAYYFVPGVIVPRGYTVKDLTIGTSDYFAADYAFNIAFPHVSLGSIAYCRRVSAMVFYDYLQIVKPQAEVIHADLTSYGAEINFEVNWLRLPFTSHIGVRYSLLSTGGDYINFTFNIDPYSL